MEGNLEGWFKCKPPTMEIRVRPGGSTTTDSSGTSYEYSDRAAARGSHAHGARELVDRLAACARRAPSHSCHRGWRLFRATGNWRIEAGCTAACCRPSDRRVHAATIGDKSRTPNVTWVHAGRAERTDPAGRLENDGDFESSSPSEPRERQFLSDQSVRPADG
jgi:hypothetical protein